MKCIILILLITDIVAYSASIPDYAEARKLIELRALVPDRGILVIKETILFNKSKKFHSNDSPRHDDKCSVHTTRVSFGAEIDCFHVEPLMPPVVYTSDRKSISASQAKHDDGRYYFIDILLGTERPAWFALEATYIYYFNANTNLILSIYPNIESAALVDDGFLEGGFFNLAVDTCSDREISIDGIGFGTTARVNVKALKRYDIALNEAKNQEAKPKAEPKGSNL